MNREEIKDWLSQYGISNYTIHGNLVVDVHQQVSIYRSYLTSFPFQFGIVNGFFDCAKNELTTLEHCPKVIKGDFYCGNNQLTSLEHCPKVIDGGFSCSGNNLTSLEYCPKVIKGNFWCDEYLRNDIRYLRWKLAYQLQAL
jgi:hypothetical protein